MRKMSIAKIAIKCIASKKISEKELMYVDNFNSTNIGGMEISEYDMMRLKDGILNNDVADVAHIINVEFRRFCDENQLECLNTEIFKYTTRTIVELIVLWCILPIVTGCFSAVWVFNNFFM